MVKMMMTMMAEQRYNRMIEQLCQYYLGPVQKPGVFWSHSDLFKIIFILNILKYQQGPRSWFHIEQLTQEPGWIPGEVTNIPLFSVKNCSYYHKSRFLLSNLDGLAV